MGKINFIHLQGMSLEETKETKTFNFLGKELVPNDKMSGEEYKVRLIETLR